MCKCPDAEECLLTRRKAGQASKTSCHKGRIIGDVVRGWLGQEGGFYFENNRRVLHVFKTRERYAPISLLKRAH